MEAQIPDWIGTVIEWIGVAGCLAGGYVMSERVWWAGLLLFIASLAIGTWGFHLGHRHSFF